MKRKICLWSVAAFLLSPFSTCIFVATVNDGAAIAMLIASVLLSIIMPSYAARIRLKKGETGKVFEILSLIISSLLNGFFCLLAVAFFSGNEGLLSSAAFRWLLVFFPVLMPTVAYVIISRKKK